MTVKRILLLSLVVGCVSYAHTFRQIRFDGLSYLSEKAAMEIAGIKPGEDIGDEEINEAIVRLYAEGYFEDVEVEQKGATLLFHVKEKPAIANVTVNGIDEKDAKKVLESAGIKKGEMYDEANLRKAKRALNDYLQSTGSYDSVVEVSEEKVGKRAVALRFDVNKGEKIKITKINFVGAHALSKSELEHALANKEADFLGFLPLLNDGEAKVDQLKYDALRLKDTYMKHGFLDVKVSEPLMRVDYGSHTAVVDYKIEEGPRYTVGDISLNASVKGLDTSALKEEMRLRKGKIFDVDKMRKDIDMIKKAVEDLGYAYARVLPQLHKDPGAKTVSVRYRIEHGKKVKIHDVIISGNDKTKDRVIRRYLYLAPGDYFSATDLKESKSALGRTGFFESVDITTKRISEDQVDLLVKVKEMSTNSISLGGGYGSYEGLMFNANVSSKNLFGSGISGSLGFDISSISTSYNISFVNPRVWDSEYSLGLSLYKRNYEYIDYTEDTLGGSLNLGRQFSRHWYASVGIGYVDNESTYNEGAHISDIQRRIYNDQYKKLSGFAGISFDNTDDYYVPREGYLFSLNAEFASLDGDDYNATTYPQGYGDFTKLNFKFGAYYGMADIIDYDLILRFKARGTYIKRRSDDEKLPVAERLFMGGIGSVRGYQPYSISPTLPNGDRIGGTYRTSVSLEASVPLSEAAKMRLTFFYDYGMVGMDPEPYTVNIDGQNVRKYYDGEDIKRSSVGAVIEWQSGFGPINLVFGYALDDEPGDETSTFEFSMGTKF